MGDFIREFQELSIPLSQKSLEFDFSRGREIHEVELHRSNSSWIKSEHTWPLHSWPPSTSASCSPLLCWCSRWVLPSPSTSEVFLGSLDHKFKQPIQRAKESHRDESDDEDALFAELEAELENADTEALRDQGIKDTRVQLEKIQNMQQIGHGKYTELVDEKEVIKTSAKEPRCVIHFYHRDFQRCRIMDKHLAALAPKYFSTLFIRVFVENAPWLVTRLGVKVLPCVICFVDGISRDKIVGFEELGNTDAFETATLELRLQTNGVVVTVDKSRSATYATSSTHVRTRLRKQEDEDSDLDL